MPLPFSVRPPIALLLLKKEEEKEGDGMILHFQVIFYFSSFCQQQLKEL